MSIAHWFYFAFGLAVGSFLNVCIVRLPSGRSIANPPSHCPRCKEPIRYYDNIPLISFLLLGGKCRSCGEPISWRFSRSSTDSPALAAPGPRSLARAWRGIPSCGVLR
jgi:prepilin signal peptidase PulO-like enzyme (type II secretory pathway)